MSKITINIGATPNDGTGDPLRTAFNSVNQNFTELYNSVATLQPIDADLTAIGALSGTSGFLKKVGTNTWSLDTNTYTDNTGTVTSVSGTGTVSGLTLTGSVTGSGSLTLGGTLTLTDTSITSALGYTPYNSSNPNGYITSANLTSVSGIDSYARTTANTATNNVTIIQGVDVWQNTQITSARTLAQAAFDTANNVSGGTAQDGFARIVANTAAANTIYTQGVDVGQNTRMSIIEGVDSGQNTRMSIIEGVDVTQNNRISTLETVNGEQNTAINIIQNVNTTQNTRMSIVEGVDLTQNTNITSALSNITYLQGALNTANTNIVAAAQTIPQNAQTSNYTLQLTDAGKHIYYTQASNTTLYIPNAGQVSFSNGTTIMIVSKTTSSANVTVSPSTGVTMYLAGNTTSASRNVTTYGMATLIQVAANTWFINGTGVI
jgi:hypothetical protein